MAQTPPPEALLIRELRERPPHMSMRQAADRAGISHTHWRQIESGARRFRGEDYPEVGNARTIARMAFTVGAVPDQLAERDRADAAGELEVLLLEAEMLPTAAQRAFVRRLIERDEPEGKS